MTQKKNSPKKKPKTLTWYRKKAWTEFSKYIRLRDNYTCITCGAIPQNKSALHAGHWLTQKAYPSIRFDEMNCSAQCFRCNVNFSGNSEEYRLRLLDKYGAEELIKLRLRGSKPLQLKKQDYIELRELYKQKVAEMNLEE